MSTQTLSGAKVFVKIKGIVVAEATSCSYSIKYNMQPIEVIDVLEMVELAELGYTVEFSCSMFRIYKRSASDLGFTPKLKDLLGSPEVTFEIVDKLSADKNRMIFVSGAKMVERTGKVDARGMFTESLRFIGRYIDDSEDIKKSSPF